MKGQAALEYLGWLAVSIAFLLFSSVILVKTMDEIKTSSLSMMVENTVSRLLSVAESLGKEGERVMKVNIPPGIDDVSLREEGTKLILLINGRNITKELPWRLVLQKEVFLHPGERTIRIERRGGVVIVAEGDDSS